MQNKKNSLAFLERTNLQALSAPYLIGGEAELFRIHVCPIKCHRFV